jgi:peptide-methionine (S)-S-oxide reductase
MEGPFDKLPGVISVTSGYTGGEVKNPSYEQVSAGGTGHRESVEIVFDPTKISYAKLLDVFWHNVDPLDKYGQFCDKGPQYRSGIFYHDATQKRLAEESKAVVEKKLGHVATDILPASQFWPAEEYHQHYYKKNPVRYHFYRFSCGRDQRLAAVWGSAPAH